MNGGRSPRQKGRDLALQVLYTLDMQPDLGVEQAFGSYFRSLVVEPNQEGEVDAGVDAEARRFAESLVRGTWSDRGEIDALISRCSRKWRLERMTVVDRNVLRLAAHELRERREDVPTPVAVNEGIELARRFGTTESAAFVNGVLDEIVTALGRRGEAGDGPRPTAARGS